MAYMLPAVIVAYKLPTGYHCPHFNDCLSFCVFSVCIARNIIHAYFCCVGLLVAIVSLTL